MLLKQRPKLEFKPFPEDSRWAFDLAYPDVKVAIEVDGRGSGGHWGRHASEAGQRADCAKANAAAEHGWTVLRYPSRSVVYHKRRARIVEQIARVVCGARSIEDALIVLDGD